MTIKKFDPHEIVGRHINENEHVVSEKLRPCWQIAAIAALTTAMLFVVLAIYGVLHRYAAIIERAVN